MAGESAMKNASPRRSHRERAQPSNRKKFGLLEKHKDYIERSKDYKKKRTIIKTLKKKASERNPDEFYFKMKNSQVVDGVHTKITKNLDIDTIKLLKTQDLNYIIHKKVIDDHKVEKLKSNLHFIGKEKTGKHSIFLDSTKEAEVFEANYENKNTNTDSVNVAKSNSSSASKSISTPCISKQTKAKVVKKVNSSYKELEARIERSDKLTKAYNQLSLQRNLMGNGSKRKLVIKDSNENETVVYKWKRQRNR
jgi:U3 small nucleolar RNA-associated protein 11